jgi:hypothetical protein
MASTNYSTFYQAQNLPVNIQSAPVASTLTGQIKQLVDSLASTLKPADAFTTKLPYETYAAPQRQLAQTFINEQLRPEFEYFTYKPFLAQLRNQAASSTMAQQGGYQDFVTRQKRQTEQPFYNQALEVSEQLDESARDAYNRELQKYYDSPTTYSNLTS